MLPLGLVTDSMQRLRRAVPFWYTAHSSGATGAEKKREGWLRSQEMGGWIGVKGKGSESINWGQSVSQVAIFLLISAIRPHSPPQKHPAPQPTNPQPTTNNSLVRQVPAGPPGAGHRHHAVGARHGRGGHRGGRGRRLLLVRHGGLDGGVTVC